jgi:hypothetical protein
MEKFTVGMVLGAMAGALIVTNSYKVRSLVKKSQEEVMDKVNAMIDERLEGFETEETDEKPKKKKA